MTLQDADITIHFNKLFGDVAEADQFYVKKPLLAHYTAIQTIEKIIASKEVWFSNPLYMSDYQEVSFGLLESDRLLRADEEVAKALGTPERSAKFFSCYNSYRQEFIDKHLPDTYVFCLEMSRSLLNIGKRPLPRLTLRGVGLTSKDAVS